MCGRFAFFAPREAVIAVFGIDLSAAPRYNITPTQDATVVVAGPAARVMRWGLVPFWAKDPGIGNRMINARAETAAEKPSFRQALQRRRCLIPASGFYEWQTQSGVKTPWFVSPVDSAVLAFAGLWDEWRAGDEVLTTFTILTRAADDFMQPLHHRMPVMLRPADSHAWLAAEQPAEELQQLMRASRSPSLQMWPVSRAVNSPANDGPELVQPVN